MIDNFLYNWQIRDDWFNWCKTISVEELTKKRVGGMGSIIHNLFHVIDCEQIWINKMQGTPVINRDIQEITTLDDVIAFSNLTKPVTKNFIERYPPQTKEKFLEIRRKNGSINLISYEKVLHHVFTHEIHHIGQLSVWSREICIKPVSSDTIFREL